MIGTQENAFSTGSFTSYPSLTSCSGGEDIDFLDADTWLFTQFSDEIIKRGVQERTRRDYIRELHQFKIWINGLNKSLLEVDASNIGSYIQTLRDGVGRSCKGVGEGYSESTIFKKISILHLFFSTLIGIGVFETNPVAKLNLRRDDFFHNYRKAPLLTKDEIKKLLYQTLPVNQWVFRDRAILFCVAHLHLEPSEIHLLNVEDVDLEFHLISVTGRRGNVRAIFFDDQVASVLKRWIVIRGLYGGNTNALFVSLHWSRGRGEPGERLSVRSIRKVVDQRLEKESLKKPGVSCQHLSKSAAALGNELLRDE